MEQNKSMKVYKVTFGSIEGRDDYINTDAKTVLARDVESAIACALEHLTNKEKKNYYAQEVEVIVVLD